MLEAIKKYPEMCRDALERTKGSNLPIYKFDKIIVCGMGGTAVGGDLLKDLLKTELLTPIEVSKEYHLPKYADENTLVFCISYSGDTEETLSQLVDAIKRKCKIICLTSGGKLKEWCRKFDIPIVVLPEGFQQRAALPYFVLPPIVYLQMAGLVDIKEDLEESFQIFEKIDLEEMDGLALELKGSFIAVYGEFSSVARRFKSQFNENSKVPAKFDVLPDLDHHEILGYQNIELNKNVSVVFLRNDDEPEEISVRMEITKELIKDSAKKIFEIYSKGNSRLARMLSLVYMGDYLSYRLAVLNGIDPVRVENVIKLKKGLKEKLNLIERLEKQLSDRFILENKN